MNAAAQNISGAALERDGLRFIYKSASNLDVYARTPDRSATRLYVDRLGNVRDADGTYLRNPAMEVMP